MASDRGRARQTRGEGFGWIERLLLFGGLALFVFLVYHLGFDEVRRNLALAGWGIVVIVLQELLAFAANTLGWLAAFPPPRPSIGFLSLLNARIIGDAINYVTPTAGLGGEFIRLRLMAGRAQATQVAASVTVAKVTQIVGQLVFVVLGLAVILEEIPLPEGTRWAIFAGLAALSVLAIGVLALQRYGLFGLIWRGAQRLGFGKRSPELGETLRVLDDEIARFHRHARGAFVVSSGMFFTGWLLGAVEVYLILWLLGLPATVALAVKIEILSVAFDGIFFFVPAKLGTQEAGKVLIFQTLGFGASSGLAFGILRHIRELSWALIGLAMLWWQQHRAAVRSGLS